MAFAIKAGQRDRKLGNGAEIQVTSPPSGLCVGWCGWNNCEALLKLGEARRRQGGKGQAGSLRPLL